MAVARTRGTGKITGALAEDSFPDLREQLDILRGTLTVLDTFERLVQFLTSGTRSFWLLLHFLQHSNEQSKQGATERCRLLAVAFLFQATAHLGYAIEARVSAVSGQALLGHEQFSFRRNREEWFSLPSADSKQLYRSVKMPLNSACFPGTSFGGGIEDSSGRE